MGTADVVKVVAYLALILLLFFLSAKALARLRSRLPGGRAIRTLGGVPLGPNKSVQLLEIGRTVYVVGIGEDVRLIDKIRDPDEIALIREALGDAAEERDAGRSGRRDRSTGFETWLSSKLGGAERRKERVEHWLEQHLSSSRSSDGENRQESHERDR